MNARMNPGNREYMPVKSMKVSQNTTTTNPVIMAAMAPCQFMRFQNRARIMTGENADPNPDQA